jgi:hypothetical protein
MKVFRLYLDVAYEGEFHIGLFSSFEAAVAGANAYANKGRMSHEPFEFEAFDVHGERGWSADWKYEELVIVEEEVA